MSDTIKKIEGWANENPLYPGRTYSFSDLGGTGKPALLLVSTDDTVPEVILKAEAQAKDADLLWAMTWMSNEAARLRERGQPQPALEIAIETVCERHGITL